MPALTLITQRALDDTAWQDEDDTWDDESEDES